MRRISNKSQRTRFHWRRSPVCTVAGLLILAATAAWGQQSPLVVGNSTAILDPIGRPFKGEAGRSNSSGRVEIRETASGMIVPATQEQDLIDLHNPLVDTAYIGQGVIGPDTGLFSITYVTNKVSNSNATYYARVFDWTTPAGSIYYVDSAPFAGKLSGTINPQFGALTLTGPDSDGDGLPDAWELENGLDDGIADTDGDGYDDWFEVFHGDYLQMVEPDQPLTIQINSPTEGGAEPYSVSWWTIPVPNMSYHLQFRPLLENEAAYSNVWSGTATDHYLDVDVHDWAGTNNPPKGFFRVIVPYNKP